jgi:hypothetical protein
MHNRYVGAVKDLMLVSTGKIPSPQSLPKIPKKDRNGKIKIANALNQFFQNVSSAPDYQSTPAAPSTGSKPGQPSIDNFRRRNVQSHRKGGEYNRLQSQCASLGTADVIDLDASDASPPPKIRKGCAFVKNGTSDGTISNSEEAIGRRDDSAQANGSQLKPHRGMQDFPGQNEPPDLQELEQRPGQGHEDWQPAIPPPASTTVEPLTPVGGDKPPAFSDLAVIPHT